MYPSRVDKGTDDRDAAGQRSASCLRQYRCALLVAVYNYVWLAGRTLGGICLPCPSRELDISCTLWDLTEAKVSTIPCTHTCVHHACLLLSSVGEARGAELRVLRLVQQTSAGKLVLFSLVRV